MHRTPQRVAATLAAGLAALAFASPALAGSDGCDEDGCQAENSPAPFLSVPPQPLTLAPAPTQRRARSVTVAQHGAAPKGAVGAGAGGTAPHAPDTLLGGLAGAGLVLLVTGAGAAVATRRSGA
jgi:hypothetical protein